MDRGTFRLRLGAFHVRSYSDKIAIHLFLPVSLLDLHAWANKASFECSHCEDSKTPAELSEVF